MDAVSTASKPLRLGYVALADCAPLVMAEELGLFAKHGVKVRLQKEVGWATIRDKLLYGELDATQAPAPLILSATAGFGCVQVECLTAMILNRHGNAITLSQRLWNKGVRDGASLKREVQSAKELLTFGIVHLYSSHHFLMRRWLASHGIDPSREVRIVVVPPPQLPGNLKAGHVDGFCAGEPWNSLAILAKYGWCAAAGLELAPGHPEKALMVRRAFAEQNQEEHLALVAALLESCRFCDEPGNRVQIAETLSQKKYVGAPLPALQAGLCGTFDFGHGRVETLPDFHLFSRGEANAPSEATAAWIAEQMYQSGVADRTSLSLETALRCFRMDLYRQAEALSRG